MHKVINFTKGTAFTHDKRGRPVSVDSAYVYIPSDCDPKFPCDGDVLRFVDSNGDIKDIPLEQLFNFLTDQGVIDTTPPAPPTTMIFSLILEEDFTVSWTAGTDANLYSHIVTITETTPVAFVTQVIEVLAGTNTLAVAGLDGLINYTVSIKAKDVGGNLSTALVGNQTTTA